MIRPLQPAYGCEWTAELREASNQDKHWALTVTAVQGSVEGHARRPEGSPEGPVPWDVTQHTRLVLASSGDEVLDWVAMIVGETRGVLDRFRPEFHRALCGTIGDVIYAFEPNTQA